MTSIHWSEHLQLHHPMLDHDHHELVRLVNALSDALEEYPDLTLFDTRADELIKHALAHFEREELEMLACGYEHLEQHQLSHRGLIIQVRVFRTAVGEGLLDPGRQMVSFLREWLTVHITEHDSRLAAFLAGRVGALRFAPAFESLSLQD